MVDYIVDYLENSKNPQVSKKSKIEIREPLVLKTPKQIHTTNNLDSINLQTQKVETGAWENIEKALDIKGQENKWFWYNSSGKEMVDYIADYLENIRDRRVFPDVKPGYMKALVPDSAPEDGEKWENIFKDVEGVIMPGVSTKRF